LRKAGLRQKLVGQPFQVLEALLERPQEIVTREELRKRLWPDNTFVDYDLALKKAVNRLREVLGDSAENPRFVETVPRMGYRFIAPVTVDGTAASLPVAVAVAVPPQSEWSATHARNSLLTSRSLLFGGIAVVALIAVALVTYRGLGAKA